MNSLAKPHALPSNPIVTAQATAHQSKIWELGTYPGGTWASMGDVNDFGVAVAQGDLPDGSTHNFAVPLFGPLAGEWIDSARWVERRAVGTRASLRFRTRA